jgi:glutathione S-transferase
VNVDLSVYAGIKRFVVRMGQRPSVRASIEAEGISPD